MKKIKFIIISLVSFAFGICLLWITISTLNSPEGVRSSAETISQGLSTHFKDENFRIFLLSLVGGLAGIVNGIWYLVHINKTEVFD